jgi:hypothetical protein
MVVSESEWLDDETILDLLPNITPDMKNAILDRKAVQDEERFSDSEEVEQRIRSILAEIQGQTEPTEA